MAMRTATPWWMSVNLAVGLILLFLGQRAFGDGGEALTFTIGGWALVLASTASRMGGFLYSRGLKKKVELRLLLSHFGVILSLLVLVASREWGADKLGLDLTPRKQTALLAAWIILLLVSVVPLIMAELSLGISGREKLEFGGAAAAGGNDASIDIRRVNTMMASGLSIALAACFLMATCSAVGDRNIRRDVSYFKTSSPSVATKNIVKDISEPLEVLLFFPEVNEVGDEVAAYFEELGSATKNINIQKLDRVLDAELAKKHKVTKDGTIVLVRGEKSESITLASIDFVKQRRTNELRTFDSKVHGAVMKVVRERRIAYMTIGHGELNDPGSAGAMVAKDPRAKTQVVKKILGMVNYQVKDLGRADSMNEIPDDATMVLVLAPTSPFHPDELATFDRYLARGGSMLIALDPQRKGALGSLEGRLGVHFNPARLADDSRPMRRRGNRADTIVLIVKQFSSHASVTTLSRAGAREGLPFVMAGSFDDAPFTVEGKTKPKRTYVATSSKNAFRDLDNNFAFTKGSEKRAQYNMAAAIEDPNAKKPGGDDKNVTGMRVLLVGDAELFTDNIQAQVPLAQFMFADAVKWLGGEENYGGPMPDEKDIKVTLHTRSSDVIWFYGTIVGAPFLVLGFGLGSITIGRRRRRRRRRKSS